MSDADLRALERAFRETLCDVDETAYWLAWERAAMPAWATPPWHVRCPSLHPRAGDMIGSRVVVAVRDERVVYVHRDGRHGLSGWSLADCGRAHWMRWARTEGTWVVMLAGRKVPGVSWPDQKILHEAKKARANLDLIKARAQGRDV